MDEPKDRNAVSLGYAKFGAAEANRRGTGWLPDLPDIRDLDFQRICFHPDPDLRKAVAQTDILGATVTLPGSVDLRQWCSPIEDQGQLQSCTAHAAVALVEYFERKAFGIHLDGSRRFVYKVTRNLAHLSGDSGAYLRNAMGAMALFGVPPEEHWPYDVVNFDEEPSAFCYSFGQAYKALKYLRLDSQGITPVEILAVIKQSLASQVPAMFGTTIYSSFPKIGEGAGIPFPSGGDRRIGGHAMVAVGYDDAKVIAHPQTGMTTVGALLVRNSYSEKWGDHGYGWLPYEYVLNGLALDWWTVLKFDWMDTGNFQITPPTSIAALGGVPLMGAGPSGGARTFNLLTIGDSVIWGQGLLPEHKFRELFRLELAQRHGASVREFPYAHSGATVVLKEGANPNEEMPDGEIPCGTPTIKKQFEKFLSDMNSEGISASDIDYVLLDGGINDVSIWTMLSVDDRVEDVRRLVDQHCHKDLSAVIEDILTALPNAKIVFTGYFAAMSDQSKLAKGLFSASSDDLDNTESFINYINGAGPCPQFPNAAAETMGFAWPQNWLPNMVRNWQTFHEEAHKAFRNIHGSLAPRFPGRLFFVDPMFAPDNASLAPNALLWALRASGGEDEVYIARGKACDRIHPGLNVGKAGCYRASAGHPNIQGAQQYFQRIVHEVFNDAPQIFTAGRK